MPIQDQTIRNSIKKSVLSDFVSRHSSFNADEFIATTAPEEYDVWNDYCLPMDYGDVAREYLAIRESCAIFDASPMKKYCFRGADAGAFLDRVLTTPVSKLPVMRSAYGLICNEQGYLLDDGIVNKFSDSNYSLFTSELDLDDHFDQYNNFSDLAISVETEKQAGLALQGPKSCVVLRQLGFDQVEFLEAFDLKYYELSGHSILVGRLGFTGDLGYELWFEPAAVSAVEQAFSNAEECLGFSIPGYGLSALQIARIEAGMIVPGWDTAGEFTDPNNERTPYELSLGWNVRLDRPEQFAGKGALLKHKASGPRYQMKGFRISQDCALDEGQALYANVAGSSVKIGKLPSLAWHEKEQQWIGFASLEVQHAATSEASVIVDGKNIPCHLCSLPMINLKRRNAVPASLVETSKQPGI